MPVNSLGFITDSTNNNPNHRTILDIVEPEPKYDTQNLYKYNNDFEKIQEEFKYNTVIPTTAKSSSRSRIIHRLAVVHVHSEDKPDTTNDNFIVHNNMMTNNYNLIRTDSLTIVNNNSSSNNNSDSLGPISIRRKSISNASANTTTNSTDGNGCGALNDNNNSNSIIQNHPPRLSLTNKNSYNNYLANTNNNQSSSLNNSIDTSKRRYSTSVPEEVSTNSSGGRQSISIVSRDSSSAMIPSPATLPSLNLKSRYVDKMMFRKSSENNFNNTAGDAHIVSGANVASIGSITASTNNALTLNPASMSNIAANSKNNAAVFTRTLSVATNSNNDIDNDLVDNLIEQRRLKFALNHLLDIFSMGKIQEFREKVGGGHISMAQKDIWRCLTAEFLGTFLLVLIGCGSTVQIGPVEPKLTDVALCFGLTVSTLIIMFGHVSGCHINPAVTVAMLVTGKIKLIKAGLYIIVQCVGSIVAMAVLKALLPSDLKHPDIGYVSLTEGVSPLQGFGVEFLITFVLIFIIFGVCDEHRNDVKGSGALAIGLALSAIIIYGGPLTGAGINPARVLGPCVILGKFDNHWMYWLGPIGGGVVAAAIYQHVFRALRPEEIEAAEILRDKKIREMETNKEQNGGTTPSV